MNKVLVITVHPDGNIAFNEGGMDLRGNVEDIQIAIGMCRIAEQSLQDMKTELRVREALSQEDDTDDVEGA